MSELPKGDPSKQDDEEFRDGDLLAEVDKAVEGLPRPFRQFMEMGVFSGPSFSPVLRKVNENHITELIRIASKAEDHEHERARDNKRIAHRVFYVVTAVLVGLLLWFQYLDALDKIIPVLLGFVALAGAVMGGIGIGIKWFGGDAIGD